VHILVSSRTWIGTGTGSFRPMERFQLPPASCYHSAFNTTGRQPTTSFPLYNLGVLSSTQNTVHFNSRQPGDSDNEISLHTTTLYRSLDRQPRPPLQYPLPRLQSRLDGLAQNNTSCYTSNPPTNLCPIGLTSSHAPGGLEGTTEFEGSLYSGPFGPRVTVGGQSSLVESILVYSQKSNPARSFPAHSSALRDRLRHPNDYVVRDTESDDVSVTSLNIDNNELYTARQVHRVGSNSCAQHIE